VGFRQPANDPDGRADGPGAQTPIPFVSGSNAGLTPETSESSTLGIVYSPSFAQGLNLSLDWWSMRIENTIIADNETQVLDDCYLRGIESRCNAQVGSRFERDAATGEIISFITTPINAGYVETEGFDFDVNYKVGTRWGDFSASWLSTYVSKLDLKVDDQVENPVQPQNGFGGNFRLRSNLNLGWEGGRWGASWGIRYYSGTKERCFFDDICNLPDYQSPSTGAQAQNRSASNAFHDVQLRYRAPWNATIALGANNVFEHYGPAQYSRPNSGYSYYGGYDIGRFVYLKYQQRF
jgi:iron complex outermembrane receptor protein